jgi:erythromycin esterase-like protein
MTRDIAHQTLHAWIASEAIPFSPDAPDSLNTAIDRVMASTPSSLELLGFGEALHGGRDLLSLRNRLFQRLVETHGFSAIAVESSFPRGRIVNEYIAGRGPATFDDVRDAGFSHGFGAIDANRELIEWMRQYNADASPAIKLHFYGFDSPTEMTGTDSPRPLLAFAVNYLAAIDGESANARRAKIEELLGADANWENPAAMMDPTKSIGRSPAAVALRIKTEELINELGIRGPELIAKTDAARYAEALRYATHARQMLAYHAGLAGQSPNRIAELLGLRDLMMADNLTCAIEQERGRGKVFAFAHNSHLKRGQAQWQLGPHALAWWPAGAHLASRLGDRYAMIGTGIVSSESQGIGAPETGTLEAMLASAPGPMRFVATHRGEGLPSSAIAAIPARSPSAKNSSYFPFTKQSLTDYDWLAVLDAME